MDTTFEGLSMLNSERFLKAFNDIQSYLRRITKEEKATAFNALVSKAYQTFPEVKYFIDDLREFNDLRNAIIHERTDWHVIAEPNDKAVQRIEYISKTLASPPKVVDLFGREVFKIGPKDNIGKAVKSMLDKDFSQLPIYENQKFTALLTTNTIARWLGTCVGEDIFILSETPIEKILLYIEEPDNCCFLSKSQNIFEAYQMFQEYENCGKKLEAILITDTGKSSDSLLGIITISDLPKIYAKIKE